MIGEKPFVPSAPFVLRLSKDRTALRTGLRFSKDERRLRTGFGYVVGLKNLT
jgi:hypothetical protein